MNFFRPTIDHDKSRPFSLVMIKIKVIINPIVWLIITNKPKLSFVMPIYSAKGKFDAFAMISGEKITSGSRKLTINARKRLNFIEKGESTGSRDSFVLSVFEELILVAFSFGIKFIVA